MFSNAYEIASDFTHPVIASMRHFDNTIECGCGAFVIINQEGWIITVEHILRSFLAFKQHEVEIRDYKQKIATIKENTKLNVSQKNKKIKKIKPNQKWIINHSFWWGIDGVQVKDVIVLPEADLAIGRLEPFNPGLMKRYPIFKKPEPLRPGTSLCKLGFPFHNITATFDENLNSFNLAPGTLPMPRFPIEGIFTRNLIAGLTRDNKYEIKFIETSSPGLRGQSGGPIFDKNGTIWGIQSRTHHFELGFKPKIIQKGKEIEENQFLNVGLGIHPELIQKFLSGNGIKFNESDY